MRIKLCFTKLTIMLSVVFLSACMSSDDYSSSYTGDCAITGVTLGSFYRVMHTTTTDGKDTTYNTTISGSYYPMYIDQINREIYNADSLPVNTIVDKSLLSFSADGTVALRSLSTNQDITFTSTDSIDFTQPRYFTVYSTDGTSKRAYKVTINVHKVESEVFTWKRVAESNADIAALTEQKSFVRNGAVYIFGKQGDDAVLVASQTQTEPSLVKSAIDAPQGFSVSSVQLFGGKFFTVSDAGVCSSDDGKQWTSTNPNVAITKLVASGSNLIYGYSDGGLYSSSDGQNWTACSLDSSSDLLPSENLASVSFLSRSNSKTEFLLLAGEVGGETKIWKKETDLTGVENMPWSFLPSTEENTYTMPNLKNRTLINYDTYQLLIGYEENALSPVYVSKDGGRTWIKDTSVYTLPQDIAQSQNYSCIVDANNFVWMFCGGTGEIWKGRLNRLGFDKNQTSFEK